MTELTIQHVTEGGVDVLAPAGRVDSATAKSLETEALALLDTGPARLVMDFSQVDYISSAGLRVVLLSGKKAKGAGGTLVLCGLGPAIRDVFEISGFLRLFTVTETRAEAVAAAA